MTTDILDISNRITHGNLIAGAAAEGHGALTDWLGRGARNGTDLAFAVGDIIPQGWLPAPKDDAIRARVNFYADRLGDARIEVDIPVRDLAVVLEEIAENHKRMEAAA